MKTPSTVKTVETSKHITTVVNHLSKLEAQIKELNKRKEAAREILKEHVGFEPEVIQDYTIERDGSVICKISTIETSRFDVVTFREAKPVLADKFTVPSTRTSIEIL